MGVVEATLSSVTKVTQIAPVGFARSRSQTENPATREGGLLAPERTRYADAAAAVNGNDRVAFPSPRARKLPRHS
jgi:hypothetical protein